MPIDIAFGLNKDDSDNKTYSEYITDLQGKIKDLFDIVNRNADKARDKQKAYYDLKVRAAQLLEGDRVLIKILAYEGEHKLADKWADDIYVVTKQPNQDIPVYLVKREDGIGPEKTLHRNHLLHLGNRMEEKITKRSNENNEEKRQENVRQKEVAKEGKSNFSTEKTVPRPRKRRDQEKSTTKILIMDDTIDDDESDIIVVSEMAMDNVCEH